MSTPSPEELKAALESLNRKRDLELPPDSTGGRTLFHRGAGAALASRVDSHGKVIRHELIFFGQYVSWSLSPGLRSGTVPEGTFEAIISRGDGPARGVTIDSDPQVSAQRVAAAGKALSAFSSSDPVLQHLKEVITIGRPPADNLIVTRTNNEVDLEVLRQEAEESQRRELSRRRRAQNIVLLVFGLIVLVSFGSITAWIITR